MDSGCCWHKEQIAPEECPFLREGEEELLFNRKQRFLRRCLECPRFLDDLKTEGNHFDGLADLFPYAFEELIELRHHIRSLDGQIAARDREIGFLHEVGFVLQTSIGIDEVIAMALTAVTAGTGFGLNRAFLLLVDKSRQNLVGYFAIGPREEEEAGRLWQEIEASNLNLHEMAQHFFEQKMAAEKAKFQGLLEVLTTPLSRQDHLFVKTLNAQQSCHIRNLWQQSDLDPGQIAALGVKEIVLVPLVSKNRRVGLLLADNRITGRPIEEKDLCSLENFALPVSFAIERAALYERLQEELAKITEANRRLQEQQEMILRMEKMALVGKITANVAHSIRNPLTIIGGFARSLTKAIPEGDSRRLPIESIVREARRLEKALEEILSYSESLHPTLDLWDINQLITGLYAGLQDDLDLYGVRSSLQLQPELPLIKVDYKKLSYCLRNVIQTALEALTKGGWLEIRSCRREDRIEIRISHSGEPPQPELMQQLGAPFEEAEGPALGLSLCTRILQEHQAVFAVTRIPGDGTAFTVSLPVDMSDSSDQRPN